MDVNTEVATPVQGGVPHLRRVLRLRDLIFYGIVLIQPIAPVPIFGVIQELSKGFAATTILISGIAMMLTAYSYGRMAALYPFAGSAYTYVGRGLNPHLGFLAGWAMSLDYLLFPIVAIIQAALTAQRLIPIISYPAWVLIFAGLLTGTNLGGIRATARTNVMLLVGMFVILGAFFFFASQFLWQHYGIHGFLSTRPFYSPGTFSSSAIATATSFAALTYIGFDGITTLAEDVVNPRRNVLLATVLVCAFTTLFSCLLVYLAQQIWPDYQSFPKFDTAFMDVTSRVGGPRLFAGMGIVILLSSLGSGLGGQVAAARLLFGMGRDNVLPRKVFGHLSPRTKNPSYNIMLVGVLAAAGSLLLNLEHSGELLNFGAFLSFMGVNIAALKEYCFAHKAERRPTVVDWMVPSLGFLFCLGMWISLPTLAKEVGLGWFTIGLVYDGLATKGFRLRPKMVDFSE